jgi:hypothetical protein
LSPIPLYLTFSLALLTITSVKAGRVLFSLYALQLGADPFAVSILARSGAIARKK